MPHEPEENYGYFWWRHHRDASTFIACHDNEDGLWYMPGLGHPIRDLASYATCLGPVPRCVASGASIDQ